MTVTGIHNSRPEWRAATRPSRHAEPGGSARVLHTMPIPVESAVRRREFGAAVRLVLVSVPSR